MIWDSRVETPSLFIAMSRRSNLSSPVRAVEPHQGSSVPHPGLCPLVVSTATIQREELPVAACHQPPQPFVPPPATEAEPEPEPEPDAAEAKPAPGLTEEQEWVLVSTATAFLSTT